MLEWIALGALAAFFVAWNNGSNNAANAIGTVVGSGALDLKKALIFAAIFDFLGAIIFGHFVSRTIMKGIVAVELIEDPMMVVKGMIAALWATGIWVLISSIFRIPMSISEGIVGGVLGFGLIAAPHLIAWKTVTIIIIAWTILPIVSAIMAIALYHLYKKAFAVERLLPYVASSSAFIMAFSTIFLLYVKTLKIEDIGFVTLQSVAIGLVVGLGILAYARRSVVKGTYDEVVRVLLLIAAASMAFSHGANDVANSAGPLSAIIFIAEKGYVPKVADVNTVALFLAAAGIAIGIVSWGHRVVRTIGEDITLLTYSSAFVAQLASSLAVLILTRLGLPVSTTIAIVGGVAGVGLARGLRAVNARTLAKIVSAWIIAFPAVAGMSALLYLLLSMV